MTYDYDKEVEKQNDTLREKLEETTLRLEKCEKEIETFDFLPTFVINHAPKSPIPNYMHDPFIHQNLISAYEILVDYMGDAIMTHTERNSEKDKKRRKPIIISKINFQCWYLGSMERVFHVDTYFPVMGKYDVSVSMEQPAGIRITWDDDEDKLYTSKLPTCASIRKRVISDFQDCKIMHKYIIDK